MKRFFSIITLFLATACAKAQLSQERTYTQIVDKIVAQTAKELKKKHKLYLCGTGGEMMHEVTVVSMHFEYHKQLDVNQARPLVIEATKILLKNINDNEEIRPFLVQYPFTAENIDVTIFFSDGKGNRPPPEGLLLVSAKEGKIIYFADKYGTYLTRIKTESFPELENLDLNQD